MCVTVTYIFACVSLSGLQKWVYAVCFFRAEEEAVVFLLTNSVTAEAEPTIVTQVF